MAKWQVRFRESVLDDLAWFGRARAGSILAEIVERLSQDPQSETRNLETLRPNPFAPRELRLSGKYRVLFSVEPSRRVATVLLVGEKSGNALLVRGKRFSIDEDRSTE